MFTDAAFLHDQCQNVSDVDTGYVNCRDNHWLFDVINCLWIREIYWIINLYELIVRRLKFVYDTWIRCNYIHIILTSYPLLNNLHMKKPEETASKAKSQCHRAFCLKRKCRIIETKLPHADFKFLVIRCIQRIYTAVDHRMNFLISRKHFFSGVLFQSDRVPHFYI